MSTRRNPAAAEEAAAQEDPPVPVEVFTAGNGPLQVPVAGLLASDPSLVGAELTPAEWQKRLDEYIASPRP